MRIEAARYVMAGTDYCLGYPNIVCAAVVTLLALYNMLHYVHYYIYEVTALFLGMIAYLPL